VKTQVINLPHPAPHIHLKRKKERKERRKEGRKEGRKRKEKKRKTDRKKEKQHQNTVEYYISSVSSQVTKGSEFREPTQRGLL